MMSHWNVMISWHGPGWLVMTPMSVMNTFVPQQASKAVGLIGSQVEPH
jgi:hypothetical protein